MRSALVKSAFASAAMILATPLPASADACSEKFVKLFTDSSDKGPVTIHVTQENKGGMTTKNYSHQLSADHWMTEMIEPADMPWTLVYKKSMYMSADRGKSWTKVRAAAAAQSPEAGAETLKRMAKTVVNAACATDTIDGVTYDTVEADYESLNITAEYHSKYWVHPDTGRIVKSVTVTHVTGQETTATQLISEAPDLKLPTPD